MRIRGSEIRKIIREELKRTLLKEGKEYSDDKGYKYEIKYENDNYDIYVVATPKGPVNPSYKIPYEQHRDVLPRLTPRDATVESALKKMYSDIDSDPLEQLEKLKELPEELVRTALSTAGVPEWLKNNIVRLVATSSEEYHD